MKILKKIVAAVLALVVCLVPEIFVQADSVSVRPFLALGADLSASEKKEVLKQLSLTEAELADYETIEVTNADEHEYLDEYLASNVIGTRALSSVMIEEADAGSGIKVETHNISFCTEEMYTNALVTAGIEDATVTVAGPFPLSGTAALVGAMKAYGTMTDDVIDKEKSDAAVNELVVTGELGEKIGKEEAANFVATLKDKVVSGDLTKEDEIKKAIEETEEELQVTLDDATKEKIVSLMKKIGGLDLDLNSIKNQAKDMYDKLKNMGIDIGSTDGLWDKVCAFFATLMDKISSLF